MSDDKRLVVWMVWLDGRARPMRVDHAPEAISTNLGSKITEFYRYDCKWLERFEPSHFMNYTVETLRGIGAVLLYFEAPRQRGNDDPKR